MWGPSSASPQGHGSRRLRASIFFAVYAEIAFLVFLGVFLWRHANPKGGGMEMVGLSAAFMLIFLPLTLPAWILAKQSRFHGRLFCRVRRNPLFPAVARAA